VIVNLLLMTPSLLIDLPGMENGFVSLPSVHARVSNIRIIARCCQSEIRANGPLLLWIQLMVGLELSRDRYRFVKQIALRGPGPRDERSTRKVRSVRVADGRFSLIETNSAQVPQEDFPRNESLGLSPLRSPSPHPLPNSRRPGLCRRSA